MTFEKPDFKKFPCLNLAFAAGKEGGDRPCILNAANEEAVNAFLQRKIKFSQIFSVIENALQRISFNTPKSLAHLLETDSQARIYAREYMEKL
jgi:1-deoxy-D-xylulose-5-phosphate reductoisomerase